MSLLVNSLADAIKTKDSEKFVSFLDRAVAAAIGSDEASHISMLNALKELLGKATAAVNVKIQKAVSEKAMTDMRQASECVILEDGSSSSSSLAVDLTQPETISLTQSKIETAIKIDNAQFLEPRGRFNASITSTGLLLQGKQSVFAPWAKITHVARVPSHTSTKKDGEDIIAIKLDPTDCVEMNGKPIKSLVWVLSNATSPSGTTEANSVTDAFHAMWKKRISGINRNIFLTLTNQKPFLRCYHGLQEGGLYPLKCGIVFIKPLVFVPIEEIASVVAGRGGGTGNTRYVDLKIETTDDRSIEFTNIERDELASLQSYVKNYLEVRARQRVAVDAATNHSASNEATGNSVTNFMNTNFADDDDDDDDDDEDFDPDASSDDDSNDDNSEDSGSDDDGGSDYSDNSESGNKRKKNPQPKKKVATEPAKKQKIQKKQAHSETSIDLTEN